MGLYVLILKSLPLFGAQKLISASTTSTLHVMDSATDQQCENVEMDSGAHKAIFTQLSVQKVVKAGKFLIPIFT